MYVCVCMYIYDDTRTEIKITRMFRCDLDKNKHDSNGLIMLGINYLISLINRVINQYLHNFSTKVFTFSYAIIVYRTIEKEKEKKTKIKFY